jgi:prepilin signal peptidase PulO-like enzyme (type II secretory pathway)
LVVVGACVGSFLNVLCARLPAGESVVRPRSRCPKCGTCIAWYDNVPVLSYLLLWARCRHCHAPISARYPLVEGVTAGLWALLGWRLGFSPSLAMWLPLSAVLVAVALLDLDHWWIPDVLIAPAGLAVWAMQWSRGWQWWLLALAPAMLVWAIALLFRRLTGRDGMGLGDIKLLALMGLALGAPATVVALLLASVQGSLAALAMRLGWLPEPRRDPLPDGWVPPQGAIPFGPFLVLGTLQAVLLADHLPLARL